MRLRTYFIKHWKKIVLLLVALIIVGPFLLLHLLVLCAPLVQSSLQGATITSIPTTNGLSLCVYRRDASPADTTLVFIHGSPGNARLFHAQFTDEFPGANLVAYDRPGYGDSPATGDSMNLRAQVAALGSLLSTTQATNCILIGHSYGAAIALQAVLDFPGAVRGIVLVGGSIDPAQEKVMLIQQIGNWPIIRGLIPRPVDNCNRELLALRSDLVTLQTKLSDLEVPVVMVHGAKDQLVPLANVQFLERELSRVGKMNLLVMMVHPDHDHFIPWEQPEALRAAIVHLRGGGVLFP